MRLNQQKQEFEELLHRVERQMRVKATYVSQVSSVEFDDALQQLRVAVWKAFQKFDPRAGVKDTTFAIVYIRTEAKAMIVESYRRMRNTVSLDDISWELADTRIRFEEDVERGVLLEQVGCALRRRRGKHALRIYQLALAGKRLVDIARELNMAYSWAKRVWDYQIMPTVASVRGTN